MRFLAAVLLLALLGGSALGLDLVGTVPAAHAACPSPGTADAPAGGEGPRLLAEVHLAPEGERRFELVFFVENPGPDNMAFRPPREWSVSYYEVRTLGRLAPLHTHGTTNDWIDEGFAGHEVPPGERGWIGGDTFVPPEGAPKGRTYVALVDTGTHCGRFEFSRATATPF